MARKRVETVVGGFKDQRAVTQHAKDLADRRKAEAGSSVTELRGGSWVGWCEDCGVRSQQMEAEDSARRWVRRHKRECSRSN